MKITIVISGATPAVVRAGELVQARAAFGGDLSADERRLVGAGLASVLLDDVQWEVTIASEADA